MRSAHWILASLALTLAACSRGPTPTEQAAAEASARAAAEASSRAAASAGEAARRAASAASVRVALEAAQAARRAEVVEQEKKVEALRAQLASARDAAGRAALQKVIAEETARLEEMKKGPSRPRTRCAPGDPLCDP